MAAGSIYLPPHRKPTVFLSLIHGNNYSGANPGGVRDDWLANPAALMASAETFADTYGFDSITLILPQGLHAPVSGVGCAFPAGCAGIMQRYYATQYDWLVNTFPSMRRTGREYWLYTGGRCNALQQQNEYCVPASTAYPTAQYFVDAHAPFRGAFSGLWIDAYGGDPSLQDQMDLIEGALIAEGWKIGGELWPHTGVNNVSPPGYDVDASAAAKRPYMMLARSFGTAMSYTPPQQNPNANFFGSRFTAAPEGSALHVGPLFGDDLVSPAMVDLWLSQGLIVSPYMGFELTRPDTMTHLASIYKGLQSRRVTNTTSRRQQGVRARRGHERQVL